MKQTINFHQQNSFQEGVPYFDNIEHLEQVFNITFSCGDGLFYDDLDSLNVSHLEKYDGKVDLALFRENDTLELHTNSVLSVRYDGEKEGHGYEPNECYSHVKIKKVARKNKP